MTWRASEEDYDETVGEVTLRVLRGMKRVPEGDGIGRSRQEYVTWTWWLSILTRSPKFGSRG
jgi:hypothetical protein